MPRLSRVVSEGTRLFHEVITDEDEWFALQRELTVCLMGSAGRGLYDWLAALRDDIIRPRVDLARSLADEYDILNDLIGRIGPAGDVDDLPLGEFAGIGSGLDRINLSTLHSAKGREFNVVILFGVEEGRLPRNGATENDVREAMSASRARSTRSISLYGQHNPSRFVTEVYERLDCE